MAGSESPAIDAAVNGTAARTRGKGQPQRHADHRVVCREVRQPGVEGHRRADRMTPVEAGIDGKHLRDGAHALSVDATPSVFRGFPAIRHGIPTPDCGPGILLWRRESVGAPAAPRSGAGPGRPSASDDVRGEFGVTGRASGVRRAIDLVAIRGPEAARACGQSRPGHYPPRCPLDIAQLAGDVLRRWDRWGRGAIGPERRILAHGRLSFRVG